MATQVTINNITGQTPFNIPSSYDTSSSYMVKVIDGNNCVISGVQPVTTCV